LTNKYIQKTKDLLRIGIKRLLDLVAIMVGAIFFFIGCMALYVWNPLIFSAITRGIIGAILTGIIAGLCFVSLGVCYETAITVSFLLALIVFLFYQFSRMK